MVHLGRRIEMRWEHDRMGHLGHAGVVRAGLHDEDGQRLVRLSETASNDASCRASCRVLLENETAEASRVRKLTASNDDVDLLQVSVEGCADAHLDSCPRPSMLQACEEMCETKNLIVTTSRLRT